MDLWLTGKIEDFHRRSWGVYGSPSIHAELADDHGIRVGRKRVARLMRAAGLRGTTLRRYLVTATPDLHEPRAIWWIGVSTPTDRIDCGWRTSRISRPGQAFCMKTVHGNGTGPVNEPPDMSAPTGYPRPVLWGLTDDGISCGRDTCR